MRGAPVVVQSGTTCATAVEMMRRMEASSVIIANAERRPLGILTEEDVSRRIAYRLPGDTPVERTMSSPVHTIRDDDYLYHAIAYMRRRGLRHMPVVGSDRRVVGLLHLHEALAVASAQLMDLIERLTHEETLSGLREVKAAQVEAAEALFRENVPAPEIQSLLADINNDIYRRIVNRELRAMDEAGWGEPPVPFSVLVMGSGGRGESYLFPDQDNGFVLEDYKDREHGRIDRYFIELAERMTQSLDAVGIPLCRGHVMATNPVWRKTLPQWRAQTKSWMVKRDNAALRYADIFFDFRSVYGEDRLAAALRENVTATVAKSPGFLREMYGIEADHKVALGHFGRLQAERDDSGRAGMINLKSGGTLPLIEGIRLLALREGVPETSTLLRIGALHARGVLDTNDQDYLTGAYNLITTLLLRQQIADFRAGAVVGSFVPESSLSKREKDMLVDGFRAVTALRDRIRIEFTGDLF